jgi:hypothetical protein
VTDLIRSLIFVGLVFGVSAAANEVPITLVWPSEQHPVIRFTFGKFIKVGSSASQSSYSVAVTAENLWDRPVSGAEFDVHVFSTDNVRIGNGSISLTNLAAGETVRATLPFSVTGAQPASLKIVAVHLPKDLAPAGLPDKVRTTVNSTPAGASLKIDGQDAGITPKQVELEVGRHMLQFSREGYHDGSLFLEVSPDDLSDRTVTIELGGLSYDTIEMRDGTTLTGDVESMDATTVVVRVGGKLRPLDRNLVKRISLVERATLHAQPMK